MIKPASLYAFGKKCKNDRLAGRILRKLCGQDVALTEAETVMYEMIEQDGNWMDERVEEKRAKERERKRRYREGLKDADAVEDDSQCPTGQNGKTVVPHHPSIPPSIRPSVPPSDIYTDTEPNKGVQGGKVGSDSGVGFNLKKLIADVSKAIKADVGSVYDPSLKVEHICLAIAQEPNTARLWQKYVEEKGDKACRREISAFCSEVKAGEKVRNRGAALNARLAKLPNIKIS